MRTRPTHVTTGDCAKAAGLSLDEARGFLWAVLRALRNVGEVRLTRFGTFTVSHLKKRDVKTGFGQQVLPPRSVIRFHRSKLASDFLNSGKEKQDGR